MRISAKAEYACVALVELASRRSKGTPVSLKGVAEQYGISSAFLTQIFMQLKGAGIVVSMRGSAGGYQLAKEPEDIRIADVVECIDGPTPVSSGLASLATSPVTQVLLSTWQQVNQAQSDILENISLADVLTQTQQAGVTFYQI